MEFDKLLTQDDHDDGAEINILHPVTEEKTDVFIHVAGIDSKRWMNAKNKVTDSLVGLDKEEIKNINTHELAIKCLARATIDWRGVERDGVDLPFSFEACEELYRGSPFVYNQVNSFVDKRVNFTKG